MAELDILGINITNSDKVLFPELGLTKADIVQYYFKISKYILPYLKDHPLTLERFPNGINNKSFFQKNTPSYFPDWIERVPVQKKSSGKIVNYVVCQNRKTLIYLANLASITLHSWLSNIKKLDYPDRLIFDLDPSEEVSFGLVIEAALELKKILNSLGLAPYLMTTGSKGLHLTIPIEQKLNFEQVQLFAYGCAKVLFYKMPDKITLDMAKVKRKGKIFLDTLRNQFGALAVAPYSLRAKPGATIATPVEWKELKRSSFNSQAYNIENIFEYLNKTNPWPDFFKKKQSLLEPHKKLIKLLM